MHLNSKTAARLAEELNEPAWLRERRMEAVARWESLPWPDGSVEQWRHTKLDALDLESYSPGVAAPWTADVPAGVTVTPLPRASGALEELARAHMGNAGVSAFEEKIHSLNAAFGTAVLVHVPRGAASDKPLTISYEAAAGALVAPRTIVVAEEASSLTLVQRFAGGAGPALAVPVVEIYAGQASNVNHLVVQDWPQDAWHLGISRAVVGRDATLRSLVATLGARLSRSLTEAVLDGQGAHAELLGVYFGDHDQHIDNRTLQLHRAPNTSSELYYKGALTGTARAIYSGLVDIEKEAVNSDAQQANRNLLLSDGASADPSPFLEIKTSEVARASHGVSVGRPDDQVLFYLQSRGLDAADAQNLYVKGFFQEVIDRVSVAEIRALLEAAVEDELAQDAP
jgi:Fe-S cluster assembly protein SufD